MQGLNFCSMPHKNYIYFWIFFHFLRCVCKSPFFTHKSEPNTKNLCKQLWPEDHKAVSSRKWNVGLGGPQISWKGGVSRAPAKTADHPDCSICALLKDAAGEFCRSCAGCGTWKWCVPANRCPTRPSKPGKKERETSAASHRIRHVVRARCPHKRRNKRPVIYVSPS